ncbi:hypothetical protein OXX80_009481 [Metschnikowia pulcherrima]
MRFTRFACFSIAALASAGEFESLINDFTTISSTDSAAFTQWINSYEDAYKTWAEYYLNSYASDDSPAQIASMDSSIAAFADREKTQQYSDFYNIWLASKTDDGGHYETVNNNESQSTGDFLGSSQVESTDAHPTASEDTLSSVQNSQNSSSQSTKLANSGSGEASQSMSSHSGNPAANSTSIGTKSSGMGSHQAPMIVGAALAGISILLL